MACIKILCTYEKTFKKIYHLYNTRLDFDNLVLDSPGFDGAVAAIDRLVIGGAQTTALTTFGGINTGQHGKLTPGKKINPGFRTIEKRFFLCRHM